MIYQTAEDGLGDTIKPRLMEAEADLDRVLVIDESKQGLSLSDERIERAIRQTGARLIILDPIQAYMGEKTDMNRANEVRPMFRRLADVAERTGCAVILIGQLRDDGHIRFVGKIPYGSLHTDDVLRSVGFPGNQVGRA